MVRPNSYLEFFETRTRTCDSYRARNFIITFPNWGRNATDSVVPFPVVNGEPFRANSFKLPLYRRRLVNRVGCEFFKMGCQCVDVALGVSEHGFAGGYAPSGISAADP